VSSPVWWGTAALIGVGVLWGYIREERGAWRIVFLFRKDDGGAVRMAGVENTGCLSWGTVVWEGGGEGGDLGGDGLPLEKVETIVGSVGKGGGSCRAYGATAWVG